MRFRSGTALAILLLLAACGPPSGGQEEAHARPAADRAIELTASQFERLGAATTQARAAAFTPEVHGYGLVLNPSTLAQLDADIQSALAAVLESKASRDRARALYGPTRSSHAMSLEALDAAEHRASADDVQLALADRREVATYGANAPWRSAARDSAMLAKLTSGTAAQLFVTHLDAAPGQIAASTGVIWRAPSDPTIPGQSFYSLIEGSDLEQGEHVLVYAPTGKSVMGVRVPAEAIVLIEQDAWCYVQKGPHTFRRVALDLSRPFEGGYFVEDGIAPGEPVLVKGTGLLLAHELGAGEA